MARGWKAGLAVGVLALVSGCVQPPPPPPPVMRTLPSADGSPPGYYPGLGAPILPTDHVRLQAWLSARQAKIAEVQSRIAAIKAGTRAPGCIDRELFDCVATLAQSVAVADTYFTRSFVDPDRVDVNGKALFARDLEIHAFPVRTTRLPSDPTVHELGFKVALDDQRKVEAMAVQLPLITMEVSTLAGYGRTSIIEHIAVLTTEKCPTLAPLDIAQFVHNKLKPAVLTVSEESRREGVNRRHIKTTESEFIPFCGREFSLKQIESYSRADVGRGNRSGRTTIVVLDVN